MKAAGCLLGLLSLAPCLLFTSCEKDLPVYDNPISRLNFYYDIDSRSSFDASLARSTYSFVYKESTLRQDTLWFEVETMGFTSDIDRTITLQQMDTTHNAIAGKHFVAFDDPSLTSFYKIPAGKAKVRIPVVLLRDASLQESTVNLKFGIVANEYFQQGYPEYSTRVITFTDQLSEPSKWNYAYPYYGSYTISFADYFGAYGVAKHRFLIEETGKAWDDDYIDELMTGDSNYLMYMLRKMAKRLAEVNAERQAQGLDVLCEADGTAVEIIDPYAY